MAQCRAKVFDTKCIKAWPAILKLFLFFNFDFQDAVPTDENWEKLVVCQSNSVQRQSEEWSCVGRTTTSLVSTRDFWNGVKFRRHASELVLLALPEYVTAIGFIRPTKSPTSTNACFLQSSRHILDPVVIHCNWQVFYQICVKINIFPLFPSSSPCSPCSLI